MSSSSVLLIAALSNLMSKGNTTFAGNNLLDVCSSSNKYAFANIQSTTKFTKMAASKEKEGAYFRQQMARIPTSLPDMIKFQADNIIQGFLKGDESKFWENDQNFSLISSSYSPDTKKFAVYSYSAYPTSSSTGRAGYSNSYLSISTSYDFPHRFQSTTISDGSTMSESTTLSLATQDDINRAIGAIQISLLPLVLTSDKTSLNTHFLPIVKSAISAIDSGDYPYGVTQENAETVKANLNKILNEGFSLSAFEIQYQIDKQCK